MKFHEHIIRVTVPGLPCEVTREELSGELADFAHRPEHFLEEVTKSEVVSQSGAAANQEASHLNATSTLDTWSFMRQYRLEQMGATAPMRLVPGNGRHLTFPCRSKNQSLGNSSSASFISKIAQKCRQQ